MSEESFRVAELLLNGDTCGHVLAKLALDSVGRDSPDLVRAMSGLAVGMGRGLNCGCLTGGCCVLGFYGGRADENETVHPRFDVMVEEFSGWFIKTMTETYGGVDCKDVIHFDPARMQERCPALILESWEKIKEILEKNRVNPEGPAPAKWEAD